ncbi:LytR family transcriptional regulator, partial [Streptomyces ipomoeae]|nr:LytR family transcriptional regulator [Streptomyces ipomoeae]
MTGEEDEYEDDNGGADRRPQRLEQRLGRRSRWLKIAGCTLAGVLVLGAGGAGWAFWQLNGNIKSVDINSALGDD